MTSTTERQQFEEWFTNKYPRSYWGVEKTASGEYQGGLAAPLWEAWQESRGCMANREAQPVGYIDPDSLKEYRGQRAGGSWSAVQRTTSGLNMTVPIYLTAPPAPAVPDGFKLMPLEMTDEIGEAIAMEARCCGGIALCIYEAALAAAPEGGNDHDTRR